MILRRPPQAAHSLRSEENTRQQGRPPQPMAAGCNARIAVRRRRLGNRLGRRDAAAVTGPGGQDPVVTQEMKPGPGNQSRQFLIMWVILCKCKKVRLSHLE